MSDKTLATKPVAAPTPGSSASNPLVIYLANPPAASASATPITVVVQVPPSEIKWTEKVQAISTPLVAVLAGVIAFQQWRTARNKLKLDLFEKRFAVFEGAATLIVKMASRERHESHDVHRLMAKLKGADFLFDESVDKYLTDDLMGNAAKLMSAQYRDLRLQGQGDEGGAMAAQEERDELRDWFDKQLEVLRLKMRPFLTLTH